MGSMERYVDGFLIPIAKDRIGEYREMAQKAGEVWKEHGAIEYCECVGDDLDIEEMVSFKKAADTSDEETVIFSWIVFESKLRWRTPPQATGYVRATAIVVMEY